ncbi:aminotransferase class IV [Alistipes sp.]|uniref:aminotransferase class IV n=1 Tax=Alistipes sp. TaxID=1872444 RepID=UPI003AEF9287
MTGLYLYQTVHFAAGRPRLLAEHVGVLRDAARTLFGVAYAPDLRLLEKRIATLAAAERYPAAVSGFVRIELDAEGTERLLPAGVSLYDGYALRSLMPAGITLHYDLPLTEAPTSARETASLLARQLARRSGCGAAVRCDREGALLTADDAPLLAVKGTTIFTSPAPQSVERWLGLRAAEALGLEVREQPVAKAALPELDELFYIDHRGVTALSHCDGHPYMALTAERIAGAMEQFFRES